MRALRIDSRSPYHTLLGVGGIGSGSFFALEGNQTLGRNESRPGRLLDIRDYCKLHIISHYISRLLGAGSDTGFRVLPIGVVGEDAAGRQVVQDMAHVGMDTRFVRSAKDKPTLFSVCFQYPDGSGGNITTSDSAAATLGESDIDAASEVLKLPGARAIALAAPEVPLQVRHYFLELASRNNAFCVASFVAAEITAARESGLFRFLDLVSVNESEAAELVGEPFVSHAPEGFIRACQDFLCHSFPKLQMVVSAGALGAYAVAPHAWEHCPTPKLQPVSTAGAGDALLGGILAATAAGIPLFRTQGAADHQPGTQIETALGLGVLLASYKCLSPHTIHPGACLTTLIEFARAHHLSFAPSLQRLLS